MVVKALNSYDFSGRIVVRIPDANVFKLSVGTQCSSKDAEGGKDRDRGKGRVSSPFNEVDATSVQIFMTYVSVVIMTPAQRDVSGPVAFAI